MEQQQKQQNFKQRKQREFKTVYSPCQITKRISLPITAVNKTLHQTLESTISKMISGKCITEGYVKPNTVKVITHSSGLIKADQAIFDVVFNCEVCFPVSGMNLNCIAKTITKAGIMGESSDETPSPFKLTIARDHYFDNDYFNSIEENQKFVARVIAQRFELNDKYVSIIADLVTPAEAKKPMLLFDD